MKLFGDNVPLVYNQTLKEAMITKRGSETEMWSGYYSR
jgi:hypothetical protein